MSLPGTSKLQANRSLYLAVFVAMATTLTLSFFIFREISVRLERKHLDPVFDRLDALQLESSMRILDAKGPKELEAYLVHLDRLSGGARHYLLDPSGKDVLTGQDRTSLLPPPPMRLWRVRINGHAVSSQRSTDGRFWFAAEGIIPTRSMLWVYLPYYVLVAGATGLLCWLASIAVFSPIRNIAASIALFGQGVLSARIHSKRQDEVGQLANAFDRMAQQLEHMILMERRLLGDVSHELRSPLARLKFATRLARTSTDIEAALDRIDRDVDRMTSLVAGIVDVASAEGDFDHARIESVFLAGVLDEVVHDCSLEAEMRPCSIAMHGGKDVQLRADRELLRRAFENVMRNAIRYSPAGSTIDVSTSLNPQGVELTIRDHGPGVRDDQLTRIFDPFFRGEEALHNAPGGSGLGLSIARRAILFHGGAIEAHNASPGLSVRIFIPYAHQPATDATWDLRTALLRPASDRQT